MDGMTIYRHMAPAAKTETGTNFAGLVGSSTVSENNRLSYFLVGGWRPRPASPYKLGRTGSARGQLRARASQDKAFASPGAGGRIVGSGAEIIHEGGMDRRLALFAGFAKTLRNRTETGHKTGQEIAVEKFLYGTHHRSLILLFVSPRHIFCPGCHNNGQFCMTVM
ncbi:hypothetical protein RJJ63_19865 [Rhizobium hidalgonense]|uniref:hypothetical protein n=1 Tax=Rhizobium hidalgonense TaxID=1538159 RepID=UPI00287152AC|nr:hypothetical protein [Rhizobium hidalgonense]MDR9821518.1 hypothetical protein [Rhizobium hidalgonense]